MLCKELPNGSRYAPSGVLMGGTRSRYFMGISLKPPKVPENAHAAQRQSHHDSPGALPGIGCILIPVLFRDAVLGVFCLCKTIYFESADVLRCSAFAQLH